MEKRIAALRKKAEEKGQWSLSAAATVLLSDPAKLDYQINVVGALHEHGYLRNSLEPYWKAWGTGADAPRWINRCIERLLASDVDYWAVAALLGWNLTAVMGPLKSNGFGLVSVRYAESYDAATTHIAVFSKQTDSTVLAPVLEIGWDSSSLEVMDSARWRAVLLEEQETVKGNLVGKGSGSYYLRAKLPYGSWRIQEDEFILKKEWCIECAQTAVKGYG